MLSVNAGLSVAYCNALSNLTLFGLFFRWEQRLSSYFFNVSGVAFPNFLL